MRARKEFLVVNCLSQGFAVCGPPEPRGGKMDSVDLEMVLWGTSLDKAIAMAADLNAGTKIEHIKD